MVRLPIFIQFAYRANHGQFNTVWGNDDAGKPLGWLLNLKRLMPGNEQRRISKTYISAFLAATLQDCREYLPLFEDLRVARDWLPDRLYMNRYEDASFMPLGPPTTKTPTLPPRQLRAAASLAKISPSAGGRVFGARPPNRPIPNPELSRDPLQDAPEARNAPTCVVSTTARVRPSFLRFARALRSPSRPAL